MKRSEHCESDYLPSLALEGYVVFLVLVLGMRRIRVVRELDWGYRVLGVF